MEAAEHLFTGAGGCTGLQPVHKTSTMLVHLNQEPYADDDDLATSSGGLQIHKRGPGLNMCFGEALSLIGDNPTVHATGHLQSNIPGAMGLRRRVESLILVECQRTGQRSHFQMARLHL